jgi:pyruvate kinase
MEELLDYLNAERGRRVWMAHELGINPASISQWDRVPVERVNDISRLTGIPRENLRPDIFGEAA